MKRNRQRSNSSGGITKKKRKAKNKTNEKINKLFDNLRNETDSSQSSTDTVIEIIDSECNETVKKPIIVEDTNKTPNKVGRPRSDINTCPLQCSTPKNNTNKNNDTFNKEVINLTKEINNDSYITIDLTENSTINNTPPTVIDLVNETVSIDSNISMSGDSDVTVQSKKRRQNKRFKNLIDGIDKLDSSARGNLLEVIARKIFGGCQGPKSLHHTLRASTVSSIVENILIFIIVNHINFKQHPDGISIVIMSISKIYSNHCQNKPFSD